MAVNGNTSRTLRVRQLDQANLIYGVFAIVIVLLSWLYLGAQLLLYAAEVNVVLARRLWPRSLLAPEHQPTSRKERAMPGLLRGVARTAVIAGTATAVSNRVSRRQGQRWAEQEQQQAMAYEAPPPAPADDMDSKLAQLRELAELKDQGVLTEAEFQAQKSHLLGS
jgi:hypothetical protein